jgi:leucyl aminopeptidase
MSRETSLTVELGAGLPATDEAGGAVAVGLFTDEPRLPETLDGSLRELCERVTAEGEFKGEEETTLLIHAPGGDGGGVRRVLLVGLGARGEFDAGGARRAAGAAVRAAKSARSSTLHFVVPSSADVRALAEGAHLGLYENGFYQK